MKAYLKSIRALPRVNREEERELWERNRRGDPDARNLLALIYLWLVVKVSRRFHENGLDRDDICQEGFLGLLDAIVSWDPDGQSPFPAYAWHHVRGRILDAMLWTGHTIRPGSGHRSAPPIPTISIFIPLGDSRDLCIVDQLVDKVPGLDDILAENLAAGVLDRVLCSLPEKEETVLRRHYGIGVPERTLKEIGKELGFSRQYVHQVEQKALSRLRRRKELRELAS